MPHGIGGVAAGCSAGAEAAVGERLERGAAGGIADISTIISRCAALAINGKPDAVAGVCCGVVPVHAGAGVIQSKGAMFRAA